MSEKELGKEELLKELKHVFDFYLVVIINARTKEKENKGLGGVLKKRQAYKQIRSLIEQHFNSVQVKFGNGTQVKEQMDCDYAKGFEDGYAKAEKPKVDEAFVQNMTNRMEQMMMQKQKREHREFFIRVEVLKAAGVEIE